MSDTNDDGPVLRYGPVSVRLDEDTVGVEGRWYCVPRSQYLVLKCLIQAEGRIVSRTMMQRREIELEEDDHIERHIALLQRDCPRLRPWIRSRHRQGYYLVK